MAYITKAERLRREKFDKQPFVSKYFKLSYRKRGAFGNPMFPWLLTLKSTNKHKSGHRAKWAAQEEAKLQDQFIDDVIESMGLQIVVAQNGEFQAIITQKGQP